ncbi:PDZK1-interacting protein 1 [Cygnus olor]|uniref:PDZK1-interacting protein 1 n=1 Tax=Cygnus olor TaxID=8869 RepID=UPI001ADEBCBC|nr:PDZK1-interacting protein 1 [Cygnus olor]
MSLIIYPAHSCGREGAERSAALPRRAGAAPHRPAPQPRTVPAPSPHRPRTMPALGLVALGLLLALEPASCQEARGKLQPWSQGVIAVVVFLVLVAIVFVVNRFWCNKKKDNVESGVTTGAKEEAVTSNSHEGRYMSTANDFRSEESKHAYENTLEPEERVMTTAM